MAENFLRRSRTVPHAQVLQEKAYAVWHDVWHQEDGRRGGKSAAVLKLCLVQGSNGGFGSGRRRLVESSNEYAIHVPTSIHIFLSCFLSCALIISRSSEFVVFYCINTDNNSNIIR